jgi:hypothetical protein
MEAHTQKPQMGLTFEDVWAMFQETDKKFQENAEQTLSAPKRRTCTSYHSAPIETGQPLRVAPEFGYAKLHLLAYSAQKAAATIANHALPIEAHWWVAGRTGTQLQRVVGRPQRPSLHLLITLRSMRPTSGKKLYIP